MNHKRNRTRLLAALLAVSSTTLFTNTVHAQEIKGNFTLPFAAQWGSSTLSPGDYTFSARSSSQPFILTVRGNGVAAMIMARGQVTTKSNRSYFDVTRVGNHAVISALQLAPCGMTFFYPSHNRTVTLKEASNNPGSTATLARNAPAEIPMQVRKP